MSAEDAAHGTQRLGWSAALRRRRISFHEASQDHGRMGENPHPSPMGVGVGVCEIRETPSNSPLFRWVPFQPTFLQSHRCCLE